jgi:hypothetical protein
MPKQLLDLILRLWRFAVPVAAAAALAACTAAGTPEPISSNPIQDINTIASNAAPGVAGDLVTQFQNAEYNLTTAQTDGLLSATDAAPACIHSANVLLGIDPGGAPAVSFTPKETGLFDTASVLYILAQQALALKAQGLTITPQCEQLIGHIMLQVGALTAQGAAGFFGGGALPSILPMAHRAHVRRAVPNPTTP